MLKTASIIAMVAVCVSSVAFAASIVDKNGKLIGEIISFNVWPGAPIDGGLQAVVVAQHEGTPYSLRVGRQTIGATHQLFFESRDCTGTAGIPMFPEDSQELLISPSALGPDEMFWIMKPEEMVEMVTESFWNEVTGECETIEPTMQSLALVRAIGRLNSECEAPFSVISHNGE
jgi:hypothetical protein